MKKQDWIGPLGIALILVANAFFLRFNAFRGFNFFDMGAFLDASWRVYKGQRPFIDFLYISGPIHLYMNAFFFSIFGFGKTAILMHIIAVHSIVIVITYVITRKYTPVALALLASLLTTTCFYWTSSHPWHDQSAHLWGILAIAVLIFQLPFQNPKHAFKIGVVCGILVVSVFFTKTNVGSAYGLCFLITLMSVPDISKKLSAVSGYALGAFIAATVFIVLIGSLSHYLEQTFLTWNIPIQRIRRSLPLLFIPTWLHDYYWLAAVIVLYNIREKWDKLQPLVSLYLGVVFVALFSMATGTMKQSANIPLMGICMALSFVLLYLDQSIFETKQQKIVRKVSLGLLTGITILLIQTSAKRGLHLDTWAYGNLDPVGNYSMKSEPIKGWMAPKETGEAVDFLVRFIKQNIPKNESLLVLTDLQILYALTNRESYKGIPFIFYENEEPPPGKQLEQVRNYILSNPPRWIITHTDSRATFFVISIIPYLGLEDFVKNNYVSVQTINQYIVLKHK